MALSKRSLNVLLAAGFTCVAIGVFLLIFISAAETLTTPISIPVVLLISSLVILACAYLRFRNTWTLFSGLFLLVTSFTVIICGSDLTAHSMQQLWPVLAIACGITYFVSHAIIRRRISLSNIMISSSMIFMGIMFLLFSLKIISIPFRQFAARWWPALLIIFGVVLIIIFLYMNYSGNRAVKVDDGNDEEV